MRNEDPMIGVRYVHDSACPDCASQAHEAIAQLRACDRETVYAVERYDTREFSEPPVRGLQIRSGARRCGATVMLITSAVEAWPE